MNARFIGNVLVLTKNEQLNQVLNWWEFAVRKQIASMQSL